MRHYIRLVEQAVLSGRFFHGTSTGKRRSTTGLYVTNDEGWARSYAETAAEVYGGEPVVLAGHIHIRRPKLLSEGWIETIGYDDEMIAELEAAGYDSAYREDGQEVFLFSHRSFVVEPAQPSHGDGQVSR